MQIFIKTPAGHTIILSVTPNTFIQDIKNMIKEHEKIPKEDQRLIYCKEMDDHKRLMDYDVQNFSTISLLIKTKRIEENRSLIINKRVCARTECRK
mgnify:CR=1 FL=1|jgi:Ubiquitin family.